MLLVLRRWASVTDVWSHPVGTVGQTRVFFKSQLPTCSSERQRPCDFIALMFTQWLETSRHSASWLYDQSRCLNITGELYNNKNKTQKRRHAWTQWSSNICKWDWCFEVKWWRETIPERKITYRHRHRYWLKFKQKLCIWKGTGRQQHTNWDHANSRESLWATL